MRLSGWIRPALVAGTAALLLAACGGSATGGTGGGGYGGGGGSTTPTSNPTPAASSGSASMVKTVTATVQGKSETILVDGQGMTLYYYSPDKGTSVTCASPGGCAPYWSPLKAGSTPQSPISGVSGTFSTDPGPSGGSVVTYNSWPLYSYNEDTAPGQTKGQGVMDTNRHGVEGVWYVATPSLAAPSSSNSGY